MALENLKRDLATDVAKTLGAAVSGPSVVLLIRPNELPRALVTDGRGVVTPRILDYVDLLSALDSSSVIQELEREPVRTLPLAELPAGTLCVDLVERPSGNSYAVTGTSPPAEHLVVLDEAGETSTHLVPLPRIAWRAVWDERRRSVRTLSLALCSPQLEGEPDGDTELYRWPFSNVYHTFGGALEGVCWPAKDRISLELREIPAKLVTAFAGMPNDADHYTRDLCHNAPASGYRPFLDLIEQRGGLEHDWLNPCAMTIKHLHDQRRRES